MNKEQKNKILTKIKKAKKVALKKIPSPRLSTIKMVEETLINSDLIKVPELKRKLPKQVNHNNLMAILDYLEASNRILCGRKGILWIVNDSPKMKEAVKNSIPYEEVLRRASMLKK